MGSTFGGIVQAGTGLNAATYGLQVVSQNIDNADTPGYTRQTSQQVAVDGVRGVPTLYVSPTNLEGVAVASTQRMNDPVLDLRSRTEHARSGSNDTTAAVLSNVEDVFPEPSNTGLTEELNKFWNAWSGVANDPGNSAPRSVLLGAANTVANMLNSMSGSLKNIASSTQLSLSNTVTDVNSAAVQLDTLNRQIAVGTASGQDVNNLLDQRDVLIDKLSTDVGATYSLNANNTVDVSVGGQPLVQFVPGVGGAYNTVSLGAGNVLTMNDGTVATTPASVKSALAITAPGTITLPTGAGGNAGAYQAALNNSATPDGIPYYQNLLDSVATALSTAVNSALAAGKSNNPNATAANGNTPYAPVNMFTIANSSDAAATLSVTLTNPSDIAAASASATPGALDGSNALTVSLYGTTLASAASPDKTYQNLVGAIGQASAKAVQVQLTQGAVTTAVDNLRTAASGVSTDEEISHLLTYQRAFQASSRVITTMDDMLDTLINKMG